MDGHGYYTLNHENTNKHMKLVTMNDDGDDRKNRLELWEAFQQLKEQQWTWGQLPTHPEARTLRKLSWEGMITIRFETDSYTADNGEAQSRRDNLVKCLMKNLIHRKWKKRDRNVFWVATTEFGSSEVGHCHILFTFLPNSRLGTVIPANSDFEGEATESLHFVCDLVGCPRSSVDLHWSPKFDDVGLASYFAKREPGRNHKHFYWCTDDMEWILELIEIAGREEAA